MPSEVHAQASYTFSPAKNAAQLLVEVVELVLNDSEEQSPDESSGYLNATPNSHAHSRI